MKIGILGTAAHYAKAPFSDPSWEIWACNNGIPPRWDRWFQLHADSVIDEFPGYREWLAGEASAKPVYLQKLDRRVPGALVYPLDAMKGIYGDWFLTSTIAMMLALALETFPNRPDGERELGIWGVDMASSEEYLAQKPACRFFLQLARMRGVKITVPEECDLLTPGRVYGYDPDPWLTMKAKAKRDELAARGADIDNQLRMLAFEAAALKGAKDIKLSPEQIDARLEQIAASSTDLGKIANVLSGGIQTMEYVLTNWTGEHA